MIVAYLKPEEGEFKPEISSPGYSTVTSGQSKLALHFACYPFHPRIPAVSIAAWFRIPIFSGLIHIKIFAFKPSETKSTILMFT